MLESWESRKVVEKRKGLYNYLPNTLLSSSHHLDSSPSHRPNKDISFSCGFIKCDCIICKDLHMLGFNLCTDGNVHAFAQCSADSIVYA